jgi:MFS family permease
LADKWSKAKTIQLGSILMFAAIVVTVWAVERGAESEDGKPDSADKARWSYFVLLGSMIAWGIVGGITNGPAQALFADALPENLRTVGYTYLVSFVCS